MPGVHRPSLLAHRTPFIGRRSGVTLIEILVVVGIIGILVAVIGLVGHTVKEKGKRELTRSIMDTLMSAIEEFHTTAFVAPVQPGGWPRPPNAEWRTAFDQPPPAPLAGEPPYEPSDQAHSPDTYDPVSGREFYLTELPGGGGDYFLWAPSPPPPNPVPQTVPNKSIPSIEGLWISLQFPVTNVGGSPRVDTAAKANIAKILGKIPEDMKREAYAGTGRVYTPIAALMTGAPQPGIFVNAVTVVDAWGRPLRYRYYTYRNNNRPFLWSAGPDGKFAADPNRTENDPNGRDDIFSDRKD